MENKESPNQIKECKPRELYRASYVHGYRAYETLFNYSAPKAYRTSDLVDSSPMVLDGIIQPFINAPLIYELAFLDKTLRSLKSPIMKRENIHELKFPISTPSPIYLLEIMLFDYKHPVPVSVDSSDLQRLEDFLRGEKILTTGKISGALSLAIDSKDPENRGKYKGIIALGVNDIRDEKPIGIVFIPEEMVSFSIEKGGSYKPRRKLESIRQTSQVLN